MTDPRVVSLLPAATEIVYALGMEPIAVSHECDYPPAATERPAATRSRVDDNADTATVNDQVDAAMSHGGVYEINETVLIEAEPDVVLTQGVCEVCAVDSTMAADAVDRLGLDADLITTHPHTLDDVLDDIRRIGGVLDRGKTADAIVSDLKDRIETVKTETATMDPPRVAFLDWMDPVMTAGHWVPELVTIAGGTDGLAEPGQPSRVREWTRIVEYDPEVLIIAPCGFSCTQTLADVAALTRRPGWGEITAVRKDRVYAMDGHDYVNRPGPRIVDTLEHVAGLLHPDHFPTPPATVAERVAGRTTKR